MKKSLLSLFAVVLLSVNLIAQKKANVTFQLKSYNLKSAQNVFLTGNLPELGNWNPSGVLLEKINDSTWQKNLSFEIGTEIDFKFTKGSWSSEALNPDLTVPQNSSLFVKHDTTFNVTILNWRDDSPVKVVGQITGQVVYHRSFVFDGLKPRNIIVWLPPGYNTSRSKHYPVMYMHDGQNLFDPNTSSMFIDWKVDETADSLICKKEIRPLIVVGIFNTDDRGTEYSDTPQGHLYMKGIVRQLKPFIDSHYRTLPDKKNTLVGGSSLGGLISFMCAWEYPNVFSKAACFSPAFKIEELDYVKNVVGYSGRKKNLKFYFYNGGVDLEAKLQPGIDAMIEALKEKGYKKEELFVDVDKSAKHNESAWSKVFWRPLKLFLGTK